LNRAAQHAARPESSPLDVWSHSVEGMKQEMQNADPNRPPPLKQSAEALGRSVAGDWHSASPSGVGKGLVQQAKVLKNQLAQLGPLKEGPPPAGFMQHVGLAFGLITSAEQLVSTTLSMIPFPALPAVRVLDFAFGLPHAHAHPPNTPPA